MEVMRSRVVRTDNDGQFQHGTFVFRLHANAAAFRSAASLMKVIKLVATGRALAPRTRAGGREIKKGISDGANYRKP